VERKEYARAERFYREALAMFAQTLPAGHPNVGVTRIKLGRALLRQHRYAQAEAESRAGYEIVSRTTNTSVRWLQSARQDLAEEYGALGQPEKAARFQAELASMKGQTQDLSTKH
jgi:serine/threonine-protein kinase